jgi:hypothetical protein
MTVRTVARAVPRHLIERSLDAGRLPVSLVARVAGQDRNPEWPPVVAADLVESYLEIWAGALIRDSALVERGATRRARADQFRRARALDIAADEVQESADERLEAERAAVAKQRSATAKASQRQKADIAKQAETRKRKTKAAAAKKTSVVRQREQSQEEQIEKLRRAGTKTALNAEERALAITREALDADETVEVIDEAIETSAAARAASD